MIELKELTIRRWDLDSLDLTWSFKDTTEDLSNYKVDIYRSEAPSDHIEEYDLIESDVNADLYMFEDTSLKGLYHGNRRWYYHLKVKNTQTGVQQVQPAEPAYVNDEVPNKKFIKILKKKKIALDPKRAGRKLFILKRRTWGERCEVSWDPVLFHQNSEICDNCNCWGTGWKEGYFKPIEVHGMINAAPKMNEMSQWGEFYPSDAILNILNKPPLAPKDIVIDNNNERYYVQRIKPVQLLGHTIEQKAQISKIHPGDEIYSYDIKPYYEN